MENLKEITGETHPILAKTDISKTAISKCKEDVSKIINTMENVSIPFTFNANKQNEAEHYWLTLRMEQYYHTTWLISFLLPKRMGRTKLMSLLNKR